MTLCPDARTEEPVSLRSLCAALFVLVLWSDGRASAETPPLGATVTEIVRVGRVGVALPPGSWEVVGVSTTRNPNNLAIERVLLAQFEGKRLKKLLTASSNNDLSKGGWVLNSDCKRKDIHFASGAQINESWQDCWYANHHVMTLGRDASDHFRTGYKLLAERSVRVPSTMLAVTYYKVKPGLFRSVTIYFNPEFEGFPAAKQDWRANDWHKDRIPLNAAMVQYVNEVMAFGREFKPRMDAAFDAR
jgi:hypothetical protein